MKRRSLIGPMLLILIGLLFLLENLRPDLVSFGIVARYWPFLLIAWGLLRLIEILVWHFTSRPLPSRGVLGGEWVLIVFICLIGTGLFLIHTHFRSISPYVFLGRSVELFGEAHDYSIPEQSLPAKTTRVVVENPRGNTRIVGGDTQEVKVAGRRTVRAYSQSDADAANRRSKVELITRGDQILVRSSQEAGPRDLRISTDLELTVPRGSTIQASGTAGDFDILNVLGDVDVKSESGGVRLQDLGGKARVDVRRGEVVRAVNVKGGVEILGSGRDVELDNVEGSVNVNGYYSGNIDCRKLAKPMVYQSGVTELRFDQLPGQLQMDLGHLTVNNVVGPFHLTARSKDVKIEDLSGELQVSVERGDVTYVAKSAPTSNATITTQNGNVYVTLPLNAKYELTGTTHRGEVTNELGDAIHVTTEGQGATLKGPTGGGPRITIETDRGEITLRKI